MTSVAEAFEPVLGQPSWLVRRGYGSFVTLEFGRPELTTGRHVTREDYLHGLPGGLELPLSRVHGQWHLWISCCRWSLTLGDVELSHDGSDDVTMARALTLLDGQALSKVLVSPHAATDFVFDHGFVLRTWPAPPGTYGDEPAEQWLLHEPSGDVLTLREDGTYHRGPASGTADDEVWLAVDSDAG